MRIGELVGNRAIGQGRAYEYLGLVPAPQRGAAGYRELPAGGGGAAVVHPGGQGGRPDRFIRAPREEPPRAELFTSAVH